MKKDISGKTKKDIMRSTISWKEKLIAESKIFFASFQMNRKFLQLCIYDLLYYLVFMGIISFFFKILTQKYAEIQQILAISQQVIAQLQPYAASIKPLMITSLLYGVLFILFILANYTFFKGLIWTKIYEQKLTVKKFFSFALINILMAFIVFGLTYIFGKVENKSVSALLLAMAVPFIAVYLFNILHPYIAKEQNFKTALRLSCTVITTKLHYYLLPIFLLGIVLTVLSLFLRSLVFLEGISFTITAGLLYILFFTLSKIYLSRILTLVEELVQKTTLIKR